MTDWIRHGECNGCGDCCRQATNCMTVLVPIQDEAYGRARYGEPHPRFLGNDGSPVFEVRGPLLLPCPKLDGDRCSIHEEKPQYCRDTPCAPEDIEGLPRCSYWFVHRVTGEVRGHEGLRVMNIRDLECQNNDNISRREFLDLAAFLEEQSREYESKKDRRYDDTVAWLRDLANRLRSSLPVLAESGIMKGS